MDFSSPNNFSNSVSFPKASVPVESVIPCTCKVFIGSYLFLYGKITSILFIDNLWHVLDVIYYEYGSLVISYTSREKANTVFKLLQSASFDNKTLYVMLLPKLQVSKNSV